MEAMDDHGCSDDDDYNYSDQGSVEEEGFEENYDDGGDDIELAKAEKKGPTSLVITRESLVTAQKEDLRRVMEMLSLKEHYARVLLIHHRWDAEKLFVVYVEKGKTVLFAQAGLTVYELSCSDPSSSSSSLPSSVLCEICIENVPSHKVTRMDCGHFFCNHCWTRHFIVKINDGQSKHIKCMAHECNAICDEDVVRELVGKARPKTAERFDRFLLESYIEDNKRVKWCPSIPHCGNAIRVEEDDEVCEVECCCGLQFCFSCSSEAHSPCSCRMWELWSIKCRDESETVNWITAHTKPCPKCKKPVEKNGGCNLVSCICGQPFCWLCGRATSSEHTWSTIAGHSCGHYKPQEELAELAKRNLYRYMHYHDRFKAHTDSLTLEGKLKETIQEKVANSESKVDDSILRDYSWINNGLSRLFRSRRVLSYSYPFAYYMFGGEISKEQMSEEERERKQNLFEDQQQQLEANVEKLSKFLEEPFDEYEDDEVLKIRIQVINLSKVVDNLCHKMYECIENDLLGSIHINIAPYKSDGVEKASQL